jgi:hypothetical protein
VAHSIINNSCYWILQLLVTVSVAAALGDSHLFVLKIKLSEARGRGF